MKKKTRKATKQRIKHGKATPRKPRPPTKTARAGSRSAAKVRTSAAKPRKRATLTAAAVERLSFDGYWLRWHAAQVTKYSAFSGLADESARESDVDEGPTPQGKFTVDPANIQEMPANEQPAWGKKRVRLEPQKATVDRMRTCFAVRTGMYIHGGTSQGTIGCIEINDPTEHESFFDKLEKYGKKIDIEVKYVDEREKKYEEPKCPY